MTTHQGHVLVVDDSHELLGLMSALLENAGLDAVTSHTPQQALALARQQDLCLLITDLDMPEMDGLQLLQQIRQLPGHAKLPVLLMSGHRLDGLAPQPGLHLLEKPFSIAQFNQLLDRALSCQPVDG